MKCRRMKGIRSLSPHTPPSYPQDGDEDKQIVAMRDWIMSLDYNGGNAAAGDEMVQEP